MCLSFLRRYATAHTSEQQHTSSRPSVPLAPCLLILLPSFWFHTSLNAFPGSRCVLSESRPGHGQARPAPWVDFPSLLALPSGLSLLERLYWLMPFIRGAQCQLLSLYSVCILCRHADSGWDLSRLIHGQDDVGLLSPPAFVFPPQWLVPLVLSLFCLSFLNFPSWSS